MFRVKELSDYTQWKQGTQTQGDCELQSSLEEGGGDEQQKNLPDFYLLIILTENI
jgi:hypothetical protein